MDKIRKNYECLKVQSNCTGKRITEQQHKGACNINQIVARARKSGYMPGTKMGGMFGDFTNVSDYLESRNKIMAAEKTFMSLPPDLRLRFKNSPAEIIRFLEDEKNYDEAEKLGLVRKAQTGQDGGKAPEGKSEVTPNNGATTSEKKAAESE